MEMVLEAVPWGEGKGCDYWKLLCFPSFLSIESFGYCTVHQVREKTRRTEANRIDCIEVILHERDCLLTI